MTLLNLVKCWWLGHDFKGKIFERPFLGKGWHMRLGMQVCSRCDDGIKDFNEYQEYINKNDAINKIKEI